MRTQPPKTAQPSRIRPTQTHTLATSTHKTPPNSAKTHHKAQNCSQNGHSVRKGVKRS
jgi:hypothetical protein